MSKRRASVKKKFTLFLLCFVMKFHFSFNPIPYMKKSLVSILSVCIFLCAMMSLSAEDHKHELHKIGERIKEAVKTGKITEKEGWAKWHAVLREHGEAHEEEHEGEEDERDWGEIEELEHEIEIRELEFELERLEQEHDMQLMELNYERERMQREFDRERRDWDMENLQWDMRRKQMEMQMRGGPRPRGMMPPMSRGHGHGHGHAKKPCDSKRGASSAAKGKSDCDKSPCGKKEGKSCCGKCKSGSDKKESCKKGECKKSESCPKKKRKK